MLSILFKPLLVLTGSCRPNNLEITRVTLPSTAATSSFNVIEEIAAAVYTPTPGNFNQSIYDLGNSPLVFMIFAALCKNLARL